VAKVPTYNPGQVQEQALPGVRQSNAIDGAFTDRSMQQFAKGAADVANVAANIAAQREPAAMTPMRMTRAEVALRGRTSLNFALTSPTARGSTRPRPRPTLRQVVRGSGQEARRRPDQRHGSAAALSGWRCNAKRRLWTSPGGTSRPNLRTRGSAVRNANMHFVRSTRLQRQAVTMQSIRQERGRIEVAFADIQCPPQVGQPE
jgi:hypothetical protein